MEKQIEEFANDIHEYVCKAEQGNAIVFNSSVIGCHKLEMAKYLTEQGYRKQEWISVEDGLPINDYEKHWKDRNYYLVYTEPSGLMFVATFGFKEYDWWISNPERVLEQVTHYMPLPQPPKMKGAE